MKPQSGSSKTFKRRIVFAILSVVLVLLVGAGIVGIKDVLVGKQTNVVFTINCYTYSDSKRHGKYYSYSLLERRGFTAAVWHQSGSVYQ